MYVTNFQQYEDDGLRIIGGKKAVEHSHPWIARIVKGCAGGLCLKELIANIFYFLHELIFLICLGYPISELPGNYFLYCLREFPSLTFLGLCAGALISRRHVLTAYHCTYPKMFESFLIHIFYFVYSSHFVPLHFVENFYCQWKREYCHKLFLTPPSSLSHQEE